MNIFDLIGITALILILGMVWLGQRRRHATPTASDDLTQIDKLAADRLHTANVMALVGLIEHYVEVSTLPEEYQQFLKQVSTFYGHGLDGGHTVH
jgi:hypothetical protein